MERNCYLAIKAGDIRPGEKFLSQFEDIVYECEMVSKNEMIGISKEGSKFSFKINRIVLLLEEDQPIITMNVKELVRNVISIFTKKRSQSQPSQSLTERLSKIQEFQKSKGGENNGVVDC